MSSLYTLLNLFFRHLFAKIAFFTVAMFIFVSSANGQNLDGEIQDLTWVGFQQFQDASRVFVRTSDKAHYKVDSSRDNLVILILENAKVPLFNNTRPLLTQHFAGPITSIVAKPIEGASPSVNIEIRLLRKVTFNVSQTDTIVALDFSR